MSGAGGGGKARFQLQGKGGKVKAPKPAVALPQTPQQLEQVLCALLAPDNAAIQAATVVITAFLKVPTSLSALIQQVAQSAVPQARQMAAVLLRREILKLWKGLKQPAEKEQVVRRATNTSAMRRALPQPNSALVTMLMHGFCFASPSLSLCFPLSAEGRSAQAAVRRARARCASLHRCLDLPAR